VPAAAAKQNPAENRNIVVKFYRCFAGRTPGGGSDDGLIGRQAVYADIQKTADACTDGKDIYLNKQVRHGGTNSPINGCVFFVMDLSNMKPCRAGCFTVCPVCGGIIGALRKKSKVDIVNIEFVIILANVIADCKD
jgi:hypothetical protein